MAAQAIPSKLFTFWIWGQADLSPDTSHPSLLFLSSSSPKFWFSSPNPGANQKHLGKIWFNRTWGTSYCCVQDVGIRVWMALVQSKDDTDGRKEVAAHTALASQDHPLVNSKYNHSDRPFCCMGYMASLFPSRSFCVLILVRCNQKSIVIRKPPQHSHPWLHGNICSWCQAAFILRTRCVGGGMGDELYRTH